MQVRKCSWIFLWVKCILREQTTQNESFGRTIWGMPFVNPVSPSAGIQCLEEAEIARGPVPEALYVKKHWKICCTISALITCFKKGLLHHILNFAFTTQETCLYLNAFHLGETAGVSRGTDLSWGTANQYSCFLPCWAYCCMDALALETKVFFMGFPTRRHRNLWERCFFLSADPVPGIRNHHKVKLI